MMNSLKALSIALLAFTITACSGTNNPYNDPDAQRDRSGQAQDEMRRSRSY